MQLAVQLAVCRAGAVCCAAPLGPARYQATVTAGGKNRLGVTLQSSLFKNVQRIVAAFLLLARKCSNPCMPFIFGSILYRVGDLFIAMRRIGLWINNVASYEFK